MLPLGGVLDVGEVVTDATQAGVDISGWTLTVDVITTFDPWSPAPAAN